jgi:hypothetical protein
MVETCYLFDRATARMSKAVRVRAKPPAAMCRRQVSLCHILFYWASPFSISKNLVSNSQTRSSSTEGYFERASRPITTIEQKIQMSIHGLGQVYIIPMGLSARRLNVNILDHDMRDSRGAGLLVGPTQ